MKRVDDSAEMDMLDFWEERPGASDEPYNTNPPAGEHGSTSQGLAVASNANRGDEPAGGLYLHFSSRKEHYATDKREARI